jgi:di/tripeptidase
VLTARGIETVVLGYGGRKAHSTEEHIVVEDMERAVRIVKSLLADLA